MIEDIDTLLKVAENAARAAGKILKEGSGLRQVNMEDSKDVKLQADVESEKLIRSLLSQATDFPIIGEEIGGDASLTDRDEYYWIVDPLDGTFNYLRDFPMTCVSIGLWKGLQPVLGVVYDFNHDDCYCGSEITPLTINGETIQPGWAESIDNAALATGLPAGRDYSTEALGEFVKRMQAFKKIRMIGSAALALTFVAAGKCDAYYEESIRLWDVAAGLALVKSAGGAISVRPSNTPEKTLAFNVWAAAKKEWIPDEA